MAGEDRSTAGRQAAKAQDDSSHKDVDRDKVTAATLQERHDELSGYVENEDFVPDPTSMYGTLDTSGTAGTAQNNLRAVTPVFDVADAHEAITAARALDPKDTDVSEDLVVLPQGAQVVHADPEAARERVVAKAQAVKKSADKVKSSSAKSDKSE